MTGGQLMVVLIVAIVMIATVLKSRHGGARTGRRGRGGDEDAADPQEGERLRREVAELKDRLAVLERITVEKESSLERQIEQLRDR